MIPQKRRSEILCWTGLSWAVSWVISAAFAWLIIPTGSLNLVGLQVSSWRILLLVVTAIEVLSATTYTAVLESPKFYLATGQTDKALAVLACAFAKNKNAPPSDFPVSPVYV